MALLSQPAFGTPLLPQLPAPSVRPLQLPAALQAVPVASSQQFAPIGAFSSSAQQQNALAAQALQSLSASGGINLPPGTNPTIVLRNTSAQSLPGTTFLQVPQQQGPQVPLPGSPGGAPSFSQQPSLLATTLPGAVPGNAVVRGSSVALQVPALQVASGAPGATALAGVPPTPQALVATVTSSSGAPIQAPPQSGGVVVVPGAIRNPSPSVRTTPFGTSNVLLPAAGGAVQVGAALLPAGISPLPAPSSGVLLPLPSSASSLPRALTPAGAATSAAEIKAIESRESSQFASYAEAIAQDNIDVLLVTKGYVRIDTIMLNDAGREVVQYIKAINPMGDIVFIEMDRSGALSVQMADRTVVRVSQGSSIPTSVRVSAETCAGSAACGVAFQCADGVCVLQRDQTGQLYEGNFIITESPSNKRILPVGSPVAFPVIKLTEILTDPEGTILRVRQATANIQASARTNSLKELDALVGSTKNLDDRINTLKLAFYKMNEFREKEVATAIGLINMFRNMPQPLSAENQAKYKSLVDRLFVLNLTFIQLVSFVDEVIRMRNEIDSMIVRTNDSINGFFLKTRESYDPQISDQIRNAEVWGLPKELNSVGDYNALISGQWAGQIPSTPALESFKRVLPSAAAAASQ